VHAVGNGHTLKTWLLVSNEFYGSLVEWP
jgi:hypothetical protein